MQRTSYSVLMSVYNKEIPDYLSQSIRSIMDQTVKTNDFVLVCDGKLNKEHYEVIDQFKKEYPQVFNIIELDKKVGIGEAANIGLSYCKNELVAKMDSDDISHRNRCEIQLEAFDKYPDISIVGSYLNEFEDQPDNVLAVRAVPTKHEDICKYAKRRSPFNNQTVMYKKKDIINAGGYSSLARCEDYELFIRIIKAGYKTMNINESLVSFRLTRNSFKKRASFNNTKSFINVRYKIFRSGFSGFFDFLIPCLAQIIMCIIPNNVRKKLYRKHLRENYKGKLNGKESI